MSKVDEMAMVKLAKYEIINRCNTFEDLKTAIKGMQVIPSRNNALNDSETGEGRDAEKWIRAVEYIENNIDADFHSIMWNMLTRTYGIRQQAMYIYRYCRS